MISSTSEQQNLLTHNYWNQAFNALIGSDVLEFDGLILIYQKDYEMLKNMYF